MADEKGDVVSGISSVANDAFLDIKPGAGANWKIHNIYHQSTISIQFFDGTHQLEFVSDVAGPGVYAYFAFGCDNTRRIIVQNKHGADAKLIGYDGIITK